jgi:predicted ATP-dependent protease
MAQETGIAPLEPEQLYQACDPEQIPFDSTAESEDLDRIIGQARALEAIQFGVGIRHEGYNLYLAGSIGLGKHTVVNRVLKERAAALPLPDDWCYVDNFDEIHRPRALRLPAGRGRQLRKGMARLVKDLVTAIPAIFEGEEYQTRAREINDEYEEREKQAFTALGDRAQEKGITLIPTPHGYTLAPVRHGKPLESDEYDALPEDEKQRIREQIEQLKEDLKQTVQKIPDWHKENEARFEELNEEFAGIAVDRAIQDLLKDFADFPEVLEYLTAAQRDVVEHFDDFRPRKGGKGGAKQQSSSQDLARFEVNVLIDNAGLEGAPIVYEDNPTYQNLNGRVEHLAQFGTLFTNFTLIKPGALHRANGGYLILDAVKVLSNPFAWDLLKRILRSHEIRIESLERTLSLVSTISLEPEAIPLDLKVVLVGDRRLYYLLKEFDPEFSLLFKAAADFSETFDRNAESTASYARLIATRTREQGLRPLDRQGVARIIEHSARMAEDGEKLSLHMGNLTDLLREADYWAGQARCDRISGEHVQHAIESRIHRADQYRERIHEDIQRGNILIDTSGARTAQVNGLSVIRLGDFSFGQPSRITATARLGEGEVIDIERETELGGPLHSKGVLILSSWLAHRYAPNIPLSLSASLVFEQSYGMVEGDSASLAEFCALLSALSGLPIRQSLAVTGSINQHGRVQAIGGVNEKIEGFFDICLTRGLSGDQGVIIPQANVKHLMLRRDLVEAAESGLFHVYAVGGVDEAMTALTGVAAGTEDEQGKFPEGTVNYGVRQRLLELSRLRQQFEKAGKGGKDEQPEA